MNQRNSCSFIKVQSIDLWEPWQHNPNENTNRLFKQYISMGADFLSIRKLTWAKVARLLNERPRKTLEFEPRRNGLTPVLRPPVEPAARTGHSLTT